MWRFFDPKQLLPISCIWWCYFANWSSIILQDANFVVLLCCILVTCASHFQIKYRKISHFYAKVSRLAFFLKKIDIATRKWNIYMYIYWFDKWSQLELFVFCFSSQYLSIKKKPTWKPCFIPITLCIYTSVSYSIITICTCFSIKNNT